VERLVSVGHTLTYGLNPRYLGRAIWIVLIPAGCAAFALYLYLRFGNALLFDVVQRAWHRTTTWPWVGLVDTVNKVRLAHLTAYIVAHNLYELLVVAGFALLTILGWRRLPLSFSLYTVATMLVTLVNPDILDHYYLPLRSSSRFALVLFPCFITLAVAGRRQIVDRLYLALCPAALALFTVVFLQGGWVD